MLLGKVTPSEGTLCGQSAGYPGQLECIVLKDCAKDVTGHLKTLNLSADEYIGSEITLLLARAGKYHSKIFLSFYQLHYYYTFFFYHALEGGSSLSINTSFSLRVSNGRGLWVQVIGRGCE